MDSGLVIKRKKKRKEKQLKSGRMGERERGPANCGETHLIGTLAGHLDGRTTSVFAQILRRCSTRREQ